MDRDVSPDAQPSAPSDDLSSAPSGSSERGGTIVLVVAATFGLQALTTVTGIITARILGVEGRGLVAVIFAVSLFTSQLTWGGSLPTAIAKNLAERRVAARDGLRRLARTRSWVLLPPAVLSGVVAVAILHDTSLSEQLWFAVLTVVISLETMLSRLLISSLQGEVGRLGLMAVVALFPQALFAVGLSALWIADVDTDAIGVSLVFAVASALGLAAGWFALAPPTHRDGDALDAQRLWTDARHTYVSSVRPLDSIGLDRLLVGGFLGTVAVGLYSAAIAAANLCGIIGNAITVIVLPQVARTNGDPEAQRAVIRRWVGVTVVITVLVAGTLEIIIDPLIRIAFGEPFAPAIELARWLLVADALFGLRKVLIAVLQGQGRGRIASWVESLLVPVLVGGVAVAAIVDWLPAVGVTMVVVAGLACAVLAAAVRRPVGSAA